MSKHKAAGKTRQHHRPSGKRLGVKVSEGEKINAGAVMVRQSGTKVKAGKGARVGRDHTVYSIQAGKVKFGQKLGKKFISVTV